MKIRMLLAATVVCLSGCAPSTPMVDTPSTFTPSPSDMRDYDEYIMSMCEAQALSVTFDLVMMSPESFTVEGVESIVGYLYYNCLRDNGRGA